MTTAQKLHNLLTDKSLNQTSIKNGIKSLYLNNIDLEDNNHFALKLALNNRCVLGIYALYEYYKDLNCFYKIVEESDIGEYFFTNDEKEINSNFLMACAEGNLSLIKKYFMPDFSAQYQGFKVSLEKENIEVVQYFLENPFIKDVTHHIFNQYANDNMLNWYRHYKSDISTKEHMADELREHIFQNDLEKVILYHQAGKNITLNNYEALFCSIQLGYFDISSYLFLNSNYHVIQEHLKMPLCDYAFMIAFHHHNYEFADFCLKNKANSSANDHECLMKTIIEKSIDLDHVLYLYESYKDKEVFMTELKNKNDFLSENNTLFKEFQSYINLIHLHQKLTEKLPEQSFQVKKNKI